MAPRDPSSATHGQAAWEMNPWGLRPVPEYSSPSRLPADYDPNRLWVRFLARSLSPEAPARPEAITCTPEMVNADSSCVA